MRRLFPGLMAIVLFGCSQQMHVPAPARVLAYVLDPAAGEPLIFCDAPDLSVNIKVSPLTTGDAPVAAGTAALAKGANFGAHPEQDEIIYFLAGTGKVVVGDKTFPIAPGTTAYVPRGVRHGFVNEGDGPVEFVWVVAPPGLEQRFRDGGHPPGFDCSAGRR